jgi:hypothetical protein
VNDLLIGASKLIDPRVERIVGASGHLAQQKGSERDRLRSRAPARPFGLYDGFATHRVALDRKKNLQQFDDVTRLKYQCRILRPLRIDAAYPDRSCGF